MPSTTHQRGNTHCDARQIGLDKHIPYSPAGFLCSERLDPRAGSIHGLIINLIRRQCWLGGETCDQGAHFESPDELPMEHVLDHADPFSEIGSVSPSLPKNSW